MARILRQIGHWKLTRAQLRSDEGLVDEQFSITHPAHDPEYFSSRPEAERRFDERTSAD
jgi:hypothetical protein